MQATDGVSPDGKLSWPRFGVELVPLPELPLPFDELPLPLPLWPAEPLISAVHAAPSEHAATSVATPSCFEKRVLEKPSRTRSRRNCLMATESHWYFMTQ